MEAVEAQTAGVHMREARARLAGILFVLLSAVAWSLNGLYTRLLNTDVYTTLAGRGLAITVLLAIALLAVRGRAVGRLIAYNARRGAIVIIAARSA